MASSSISVNYESFKARLGFSMVKRYENLYLTITNDLLAFESGQGDSPTLVISKRDGNVSIEKAFSRPHGCSRRSVQGILGIADLPLGKVAIIVTKKVRLGEFHGHVIWRLESSEIVPLNKRAAASNDETEAHRKCLG